MDGTEGIEFRLHEKPPEVPVHSPSMPSSLPHSISFHSFPFLCSDFLLMTFYRCTFSEKFCEHTLDGTESSRSQPFMSTGGYNKVDGWVSQHLVYMRAFSKGAQTFANCLFDVESNAFHVRKYLQAYSHYSYLCMSMHGRICTLD